MFKLICFLLVTPLLVSCGNSTEESNTDPNTDQLTNSVDNASTPNSLQLNTQIALANSFCTNQKSLQIVSLSLLSAFSSKGNGSDLNYCGGENIYTDTSPDFSIQLNNYCLNARGQEVLLNGEIIGTTESGSNFISDIESLNISGTNILMSVTGNTWDGRADDNFVNLQIIDNISQARILLEDVSIKKGEIDFGYLTFDNLNKVPFKFITHFNDDNTEGLLFIYGQGEEKIIISGDNGMITAVYTKDRQDDGVWIDLPCNNPQ